MFDRLKNWFKRGESHTAMLTAELAEARERINVLEGRLEFAQSENNSLGQRNQLLHYALGSSHTALETYANRDLWHPYPGEGMRIIKIKWRLAAQALHAHRDLLGLEPETHDADSKMLAGVPQWEKGETETTQTENDSTESPRTLWQL